MSKFTQTTVTINACCSPITFNESSQRDCFTADNADGRMLLLVKNDNDNAVSAIINPGDGILKSLGEIKISVAAKSEVVIPLCRFESARVKNTQGENKGNIIIDTFPGTGSNEKVSYAVISVE